MLEKLFFCHIYDCWPDLHSSYHFFLNYNNYLKKCLVGNYNLYLGIENTTVPKTIHGQPSKYFKGDLTFWNYIGQTGSFCNQRMKDVSPRAVISFGRFRWSPGKYCPVLFSLELKKGWTSNLKHFIEVSPFGVIGMGKSDQLSLKPSKPPSKPAK